MRGLQILEALGKTEHGLTLTDLAHRVDLPPSTQAQHDFSPDMLNIAVDKAGTVWFQKQQISLPELGSAVSNRFRVDTNLPVCISGDREAMHGAMADVYEVVRSAGVQKVAFAVAGKDLQTAK